MAQAEFQAAENVGHRLGPRKKEQQADAYLSRAELEVKEWRKARTDDDRTRSAGILERDFDRARRLYEPIAGYSKVNESLRRLEKDEKEFRDAAAARERALEGPAKKQGTGDGGNPQLGRRGVLTAEGLKPTVPAERKRELFWLVGASAFILAGLFLVVSAKTQDFQAAAAHLQDRSFLNLNTVTEADQLLPYLQVVPDGERQQTAEAMFEYSSAPPPSGQRRDPGQGALRCRQKPLRRSHEPDKAGCRWSGPRASFLGSRRSGSLRTLRLFGPSTWLGERAGSAAIRPSFPRSCCSPDSGSCWPSAFAIPCATRSK